MRECTVSVHTLVEGLLTRGDLVLSSSTGQRLVEGGRIHRAYQKQAGEDYQPEVALEYTSENEYVRLTVQGRADGIRITEDGVVIEELKSTLSDLDKVRPGYLHQAQLNSYGAMYCLTNSVPAVRLRLVYLKDGENRAFEEKCQADELKRDFLALCQAWLGIETKREIRFRERNASLLALAFPFEAFREGQRTMAAHVYRCISRQEDALLQAPTGIGKTMGVFFPALKAIGEGKGEKVFYLSARSTLKKVAQETVELLQSKGAAVRFITLTAKDSCCPNPGVGCHPDTCPRAAGYYDRLPVALKEAEAHLAMTPEYIGHLAEKHQLCPFELALQLSLDADIVIGDYNYGFDPRVRLHRFFDDGGDYVLLVDECHNLLDRAREMFSAALDWEHVMALLRLLPKRKSALRTAADNLRKAFVELRKQSEPLQDKLDASFVKCVRGFTRAGEPYVDHPPAESYAPVLVDLYFRAKNFLLAYEGMDKCCRILYQHQGNQLNVKIFCIDPAGRLMEIYRRVRSSICFSATLAPMDYFARVLGMTFARRIQIPSAFPKENLQVLLYPGISTSYQHREESQDELCRLLAVFVQAHPGKVLAFFPSYAYMQKIHEGFKRILPDWDAPIQQAGMSEEERQIFLLRFGQKEPLLAFAVMGGMFGEGIDLEGEQLTAAVIVGVGLPQLDEERELIRSYHDALQEDGFACAYLFPGMNRVLQAAGRVIRSPRDRGMVLLVDGRFRQGRYQSLLPEPWKPVHLVKSMEALGEETDKFWQS